VWWQHWNAQDASSSSEYHLHLSDFPTGQKRERAGDHADGYAEVWRPAVLCWQYFESYYPPVSLGRQR